MKSSWKKKKHAQKNEQNKLELTLRMDNLQFQNKLLTQLLLN